MTDELLRTVRQFIVQEVGEDMGTVMTEQAERLCRVIRDVTYPPAPMQQVLTPAERLTCLSLVRREIRKVEREELRRQGHYDRSFVENFRRRKSVLRGLYRKLGGNPDSMESREAPWDSTHA